MIHRLCWTSLGFFALVLTFFLVSCSSQPVSLELPEYSSYVNDFTGSIEDRWLEDSEDLAVRAEKETGAEIAVAVIEHLDGITIEEFAVRLFNKWGIGKEDRDNGVLLLVALDDRELRIEVGYGLEGVITDLEAGRIIDEVIVPEFKNGDHGIGIYNGVAAISNEIYEDMELSGIPLAVSSFSPDKAAAVAAISGSVIITIIVVLANTVPWVALGLAVVIIVIRNNRRKRKCPKCGKIGLKITREILKNPTYAYPGKMIVEKTCRYCGYHEKSTQVMPKRIRSTSTGSSYSSHTSSSSSFSSSGSSFSGFGGGSSGGGGASGRW